MSKKTTSQGFSLREWWIFTGNFSRNATIVAASSGGRELACGETRINTEGQPIRRSLRKWMIARHHRVLMGGNNVQSGASGMARLARAGFEKARV